MIVIIIIIIITIIIIIIVIEHIKNCQIHVKRLIRYFSNSSKLFENRAQSPVREVKMLAVWPSITEGFPTAKFMIYKQ